MDGILKVTPEKLRSTASDFGSKATCIKTTTDKMMDIVNGMNSVWQGDAAKAYDTKFKGLQDDMDKIFRMVQEHSKDLDEMASQYTSAEQANAQAAQALSADIVS